MLKNSQEIRDEISEQRIKAQAIVDVAKAEERDLSEDEQSSFDQLVDLADALESNDLVRAEKREDLEAKAKQAMKLQAKVDAGDIQLGSESGEVQNNFSVPVRAKSSRKLQAYDNERDAYVAGNVIWESQSHSILQ